MRALLSCFLSFLLKLIKEISPLVLSEILEVFVNTLTAESKYPVQDCENLPFRSQMQFSEKRKSFCKIHFDLWNLHQILSILKKKMTVIANVFQKLQIVENLVRPLSKKCSFTTCFASQHVKACQILAKSPWERFYPVFHHSRGCWFRKCLP